MCAKVFVTMSKATLKYRLSIIDMRFDLNGRLKKNFLLKDCQKQEFCSRYIYKHVFLNSPQT